jgi:hypothetical protein
MSFYKFIFFVSVCLPATVWAAHPLVTDDAGTQGKGNFSFEVNGQYDHDKQSGVTSTGGQTAAALTYGVTDTIDLAVGIPYLWIKEDPDQSSPWENGFSDATVDVKLRLFEKDGLSFAIKPGLSFPTGDDDTGLGAGKIGYRFYMIGMKETEAWTFLVNLGYIRNETDATDTEKDLWHVSLATLYAVDEHWKIVANVIADRNADIDGDNDPVSGIIGMIYSPTKNIDLDLGVKAGLTDSATDWSLLVGTTFRF